jgi:hypothetical protein
MSSDTTDRHTMNYKYRYDISPDRYPSTKWLVIDTHNNNCPIATYDNRLDALTKAKALDRKSKW